MRARCHAIAVNVGANTTVTFLIEPDPKSDIQGGSMHLNVAGDARDLFELEADYDVKVLGGAQAGGQHQEMT